jgi:hypothetical protein
LFSFKFDRIALVMHIEMKIVNPLNERTGFINARASTEERMKAEKFMHKLNLSSHGALVRQLIAEEADQLGVA